MDLHVQIGLSKLEVLSKIQRNIKVKTQNLKKE
jgi:hypothetical protein